MGCSTPAKLALLHRAHRENLSLKDEELKRLQYYTSTDVMVRLDGPGEPRTIMVPRETPGILVDAGPDWLMVSFRKGSTPVPFITNATAKEDMYWFATPIAGQGRTLE